MRHRTPAILAILLVAAAASGSLAVASSRSDQTARCVRGEWRMSTAAATALIQRLVGSNLMRVRRGVLTASFDGRTMRYGSTDFVLMIDLGVAQGEAVATFLTEAPYSVRGGRIVFRRGTSELNVSKVTATKNGQTYTVPGPAPTTKSIPGGATPYTCTRTTLRWRIPINNTWATFRRVT